MRFCSGGRRSKRSSHRAWRPQSLVLSPAAQSVRAAEEVQGLTAQPLRPGPAEPPSRGGPPSRRRAHASRWSPSRLGRPHADGPHLGRCPAGPPGLRSMW